MLIGVATTNLFTLADPAGAKRRAADHRRGLAYRSCRRLCRRGTVSDCRRAAGMPAQHRRTYGAIYEIMLASSFTLLLPLAGFMLADTPNGFRLIALPATLGLFVAPVLVYLLIPESPRWSHESPHFR